LRKELPMFITAVSGLVVVFSRYFQLGEQWNLTTTLDRWSLVSAAFAIGLGLGNLTRIHYRNVKRRREHWPFSLYLIIVMWAYMILGLYQDVEGTHFRWIYDAVLMQLSATIYGIIAFYISSAAYRAFKIRTREAAVMMIAAVIVMFGVAPIGDAIWANWGKVSDWIMNYLNVAGRRGILLGAYLGSFAVAMRIILGLERAHLGGIGTGTTIQ